MCNENKDTARKEESHAEVTDSSTPKRPFMKPLEKPSFVVDSLIPDRLIAVLRLTEDRQKAGSC